VSISDLASLPDKLLPSDEHDPRSVKRYRLRTALVACSSFLTVLLVVLPAMFTGLPKLGQIAWAGEVDDKIAEALGPVREEIGKVADKHRAMAMDLEATRAMVRRVLIGNLAAQLRDLNRMRCAASDAAVRARAERDIEDSQQEYIGLTYERYPLPACKDL